MLRFQQPGGTSPNGRPRQNGSAGCAARARRPTPSSPLRRGRDRPPVEGTNRQPERTRPLTLTRFRHRGFSVAGLTRALHRVRRPRRRIRLGYPGFRRPRGRLQLPCSGSRTASCSECMVHGPWTNRRPRHPMVQNLSVRAALPMPKVYVIPGESPNAFATGRIPHHAAVAVTEGLLRCCPERNSRRARARTGPRQEPRHADRHRSRDDRGRASRRSPTSSGSAGCSAAATTRTARRHRGRVVARSSRPSRRSSSSSPCRARASTSPTRPRPTWRRPDRSPRPRAPGPRRGTR